MAAERSFSQNDSVPADAITSGVYRANDLVEVFKRIDTNADGRLSASELHSALNKVPGIDPEMVAGIVQAFVERADVNEDGYVDLGELGLEITKDQGMAIDEDGSIIARSSLCCYCEGCSCAGCLSRILLACCCICGGDGASVYGARGGKSEAIRRLDEHKRVLARAQQGVNSVPVQQSNASASNSLPSVRDAGKSQAASRARAAHGSGRAATPALVPPAQ